MDAAQIARDQREQIAGLGERIVPHREMFAARKVAVAGQIAVRKQRRIARLVRFDARRIDSQHIGPVEEIGDAAKTFGLALRAEDALGNVKPFQRGVVHRRNFGDDFQREFFRQARDRQRRLIGLVLGGLAVDLHGDKLQLLAIEHQRPRTRARHLRGCGYPRGFGFKSEIQCDFGNAVIGCAIVFQVDGARLFGAHEKSFGGETEWI